MKDHGDNKEFLKSKRKFVASYSSGKDSTLALYKAIRQGMEPQALIMTYNAERDCSWFHGVPEPILRRIEESLGIPLRLIRTGGGDKYEADFEEMLRREREKGAEVCVFGDIDLEEHLAWCTRRCRSTGLEACFPLWQMSRRAAVEEFLDSGFKTIFTVIDTERMDASWLGKTLTREAVELLEREGVDVCGENGEYHTFVTDGPLFRTPVSFTPGRPVRRGKHVILPIQP